MYDDLANIITITRSIISIFFHVILLMHLFGYLIYIFTTSIALSVEWSSIIFVWCRLLPKPDPCRSWSKKQEEVILRINSWLKTCIAFRSTRREPEYFMHRIESSYLIIVFGPLNHLLKYGKWRVFTWRKAFAFM